MSPSVETGKVCWVWAESAEDAIEQIWSCREYQSEEDARKRQARYPAPWKLFKVEIALCA